MFSLYMCFLTFIRFTEAKTTKILEMKNCLYFAIFELAIQEYTVLKYLTDYSKIVD